MKFSTYCFFCLVLTSFQHVQAQSGEELQAGYYVTVAAYSKSSENYAQEFTLKLKEKGLDARYGFNTAKNLYFVFLNYHTSLKPALVEMQQVRNQGEFTDAWVRVVKGDIPVTAKITETSVEQNPDVSTLAPNPPTEVIEPEKQVEEENGKDKIEITENPPLVQHDPMTLGNTEVFLSLFNAANNRIVEGEVQVIDTERSRLLTTVKGNEYLILPDPKSKSGQLTLIGEVFGYRKLQYEINYPLPLADTVKPYVELMGTTLAVKFDMVRYHKGDMATLYNVYFFNDAAIMLPESRYELNSLLEMMRENENYRIRLHGHTNGNYHGKILGLGPDNNFFSMEGAVQAIGSAKDLSANRAETIKAFMVQNGVSADRIEIKAWGGKRPLYDKHSANAKKNVRVEVEILQE